MTEKVPIGIKSYKHRRDIVYSHAVTAIVTSLIFKLNQSMTSSPFLDQLMEVGFLVHWESLLSTIGDEAGMLEDFIVAIHDANNLLFKVGGREGGGKGGREGGREEREGEGGRGGREGREGHVEGLYSGYIHDANYLFKVWGEGGVCEGG